MQNGSEGGKRENRTPAKILLLWSRGIMGEGCDFLVDWSRVGVIGERGTCRVELVCGEKSL